MRLLILSTLLLAFTLTHAIKVSDTVTVGGMSSGGFMTAQMHIAYSSLFSGATVFEGGPYYCSLGDITRALTNCTGDHPNITDISILEKSMREFESQGLIDATKNLEGQKVFFFSGTQDHVIDQSVVKVNEQLYKNFGAETHHVYNMSAGHTFPTNFFGNK